MFHFKHNLQCTSYLKAIVKTQLNHNQVEVGLTTLWVLTHPPPPPTEQLCVVVVQLSSNQQQITDQNRIWPNQISAQHVF